MAAFKTLNAPVELLVVCTLKLPSYTASFETSPDDGPRVVVVPMPTLSLTVVSRMIVPSSVHPPADPAHIPFAAVQTREPPSTNTRPATSIRPSKVDVPVPRTFKIFSTVDVPDVSTSPAIASCLPGEEVPIPTKSLLVVSRTIVPSSTHPTLPTQPALPLVHTFAPLKVNSFPRTVTVLLPARPKLIVLPNAPKSPPTSND